MTISCQHEEAAVRAAIQIYSRYWYLLVNRRPQVLGSYKAHTSNRASFSHQLSPPTQGQPDTLFPGPGASCNTTFVALKSTDAFIQVSPFCCSQRLPPDLVHTSKEEVHYNVFMDGLCQTAAVGDSVGFRLGLCTCVYSIPLYRHQALKVK